MNAAGAIFVNGVNNSKGFSPKSAKSVEGGFEATLEGLLDNEKAKTEDENETLQYLMALLGGCQIQSGIEVKEITTKNQKCEDDLMANVLNSEKVQAELSTDAMILDGVLNGGTHTIQNGSEFDGALTGIMNEFEIGLNENIEPALLSEGVNGKEKDNRLKTQAEPLKADYLMADPADNKTSFAGEDMDVNAVYIDKDVENKAALSNGKVIENINEGFEAVVNLIEEDSFKTAVDIKISGDKEGAINIFDREKIDERAEEFTYSGENSTEGLKDNMKAEVTQSGFVKDIDFKDNLQPQEKVSLTDGETDEVFTISKPGEENKFDLKVTESTAREKGKAEIEKSDAKAFEFDLKFEDHQIGNITQKSFENQISDYLKPDKATEVRKPFFEQIIKGFETLKSNGNKELTVKLKPEFLGELNVKLTQSKEGIIAKINAERPEVRQAILSNILELQEHLREKGINIATIDVYCENADSFENSRRFSESRKGNSGFDRSKERLIVAEDEELNKVRFDELFGFATVEYLA